MKINKDKLDAPQGIPSHVLSIISSSLQPHRHNDVTKKKATWPVYIKPLQIEVGTGWHPFPCQICFEGGGGDGAEGKDMKVNVNAISSHFISVI